MTEETKVLSSPEKTLGNEKIAKICQEFGLEENDIEIVIRILRRWESLTGELSEKFKIGLEELSDNDKKQNVLMALMTINKEFASEQEMSASTIH